MINTSCGVFRKKCETHFLHSTHHYPRFWRCQEVDGLFTIYNKTTRYIGYSIQQYSKRKFKNGERPTQAYEKVINSFHAEIEKALGKFVKDGIESEELKLGDVPYVYSIIPLSQTANTPIFELSYATGVRGNQTSSVENYKKYLNTLAENFVKNIGE